MSRKTTSSKKGYIKFERSQPNDLWQVDIAGVQTVAHLGKLYLIAFLDDCSRFVTAARYFRDQKGKNIILLLQKALTAYGRPNQILADNGAQFRTLIKGFDTKYTHLLKTLDIEPIFAKPSHPQTKGKLERWFGVVKQMWLGDERLQVQKSPDYTLTDLNADFNQWLQYYNYEKSHRSLPERGPPAKIYFRPGKRISRPLQTLVNWDLWLNTTAERKVNKYNLIHYEGKEFSIPPGYSGLKVDVVETSTKIEVYYKDVHLVSHPFEQLILPRSMKKQKRKISSVGLISWKGKKYTVDYKYKGQTVEVQLSQTGKYLEIYHNARKILDIPLKS